MCTCYINRILSLNEYIIRFSDSSTCPNSVYCGTDLSEQKLVADTTTSSMLCTSTGIFRQPGDLRSFCRILSVSCNTFGGHMSILVTTTKTGTLSARARPRCSLAMPITPALAPTCVISIQTCLGEHSWQHCRMQVTNACQCNLPHKTKEHVACVYASALVQDTNERDCVRVRLHKLRFYMTAIAKLPR